jgi:hypothetical protein
MNDKQKAPLSKHAMIQLPNAEQSMISCEEFVAQFPKVARYFDGSSLDRCLETFYEKDSEASAGKGAPAQWILQDLDSIDELKDIFAECGIHLDEEDAPEDKPDKSALTADEIAQHKANIAGIREGLQAIGVATGEEAPKQQAEAAPAAASDGSDDEDQSEDD